MLLRYTRNTSYLLSRANLQSRLAELDMHIMPQTIRDAMEVTRNIGLESL